MSHGIDKVFAGSIPALYEKYLVPLIFEAPAGDLVARLRARPPARVLEIAAGTGVVTRVMAERLPATTAIVATDLNQAMLDHAAKVGTLRQVEWRQADAMQLPFADASFDAVVCQFGVMFLPDKPRAFAEARRVLQPGGLYLFNVWDRIETNEIADEVTRVLSRIFPDDPPRFMARTPHGYHDVGAIRRDLSAGGFADATIDTVTGRSDAPSATDAATAYCQGTPLRSEIEARDAARLQEATDAAEEALAARFGARALTARMQWHVVTARA